MSRKAASLWVIIGSIVLGFAIGAGFESILGGSLAFAGFFAGLGLALILNAFLTVDSDVYSAGDRDEEIRESARRPPAAAPAPPAPPRYR